ncbi:MAG: rhodanese-like domain-containing protein [Aeromonas sp.]
MLCLSAGLSSAQAAELPPLDVAGATQKQALLLDVRASHFYNGWPAAGERQGGHLAGAQNFSAEWKLSDEDWPRVRREKGLLPTRAVALYGSKRQVAEVARQLRAQGITQLYSLQGWQSAPRSALARWSQLVYPRWLADLQAGKPVAAAPRAGWKLFEVDWGAPKLFLVSHIAGAGYIDTNRLEREPLWNKVSDSELQAYLLELGITHDTPVILYGRNSMAAARAAHLMLYAGVKDVRLLDGGLAAWFVEHLPTRTGLPHAYAAATQFGSSLPARPELFSSQAKVKSMLRDPRSAVVSIRTWEEFIGDISGYSDMDRKGDIAGAKWGHGGENANGMQDFHNVDGSMKAATDIRAMWQAWGIKAHQPTAFYCGTGWRASEAFFYAYVMGWSQVSVYDGGWYEWSLDPANPVARGARAPHAE